MIAFYSNSQTYLLPLIIQAIRTVEIDGYIWYRDIGWIY